MNKMALLFNPTKLELKINRNCLRSHMENINENESHSMSKVNTRQYYYKIKKILISFNHYKLNINKNCLQTNLTK